MTGHDSARAPTGQWLPVVDPNALSFDGDGLIPAIVQDATTHEVLMMAWMDEPAVRATIAERRTVFWSRSRNQQWRKGETSGSVQHVRDVLVDCDADTMLVLVDQDGSGACHTGAATCFHRRLDGAPGHDAASNEHVDHEGGCT